MIENVYNLYPQYFQRQDRRMLKTSVPFERRSGEDRRNNSRPALDIDLSNDISRIQMVYKSFISIENKIQSSIKQQKDDKKIRNVIFTALSPIISVRRLSSLPDNIEERNYPGAAGLLTLAAVNLPEDTRDLKDA